MKKLMIVLFATIFGAATIGAFAQDKMEKSKGDDAKKAAKKGDGKKKD